MTTEAELCAAQPAVFVNRFTISAGDMVRFGLLESGGGVRGVYVMSRADAAEFANLILRLLGPTQ